jgi:hypothetical protein
VREQNHQRALPQQTRRLPQVHEAVPKRACGPLPQARGGIARRASTTFGGAVEDQDATTLHPPHSAVSCEAAHCASQAAVYYTVRCEARAQLRIHDLHAPSPSRYGRQNVGKDAARGFLMNFMHVLRTWMNEQMRKSPTIGIMINESTDIRKVKVATPQLLIIACA